jgi:hypothetical protein
MVKVPYLCVRMLAADVDRSDGSLLQPPAEDIC